MLRNRKPSLQAFAVLSVLAERPSDWLYGLEVAERTRLKSGSLYPILIRLAERGMLEAQWLQPSAPGRPPRHAYRILPEGARMLDEVPAPKLSGREKLA
jgi:DNA-binding PadR family transcriptional regulator